MKSDEELMRRVQEGDLAAFGDLVRRYQRLVFGVAFHSLGNVDDARDVAQDVFIRAFTRLDQVREPARIGAWLRQVAVNECRAWRARHRPAAPLTEVHAGIDLIGPSDDRLLVAAALRAIDETSRLTVILFYLHAYSLKEIGSFLDEPVTTIKSRLRNARAKLRKELEKTLDENLGSESLPEDFAGRVTRIIEAAKSGDEEAMRRLLAEDPTLVEVKESPGMGTPLHIAAASGNAALTELLLAHGADPNALDVGDNASPLHYAAERGWLDCVRLLVESGADVNWSQNVHERGPLGWAVIFGTVQSEVAEYLIAHGAQIDLFSAIGLDRADVVRELVSADPSVLRQRMSQCEQLRSPIEFATEYRRFAIANLLVELGSEISLSEAAALGSLDGVRERLGRGDSIDHAAKAAVLAGQAGTARLLLENGANPDYAPQGTSLLFDAFAANDEDIARILLEFGADLEFKDAHHHSTALGWQVFYARVDSTRLALSLGAVVSPKLLDLAQAGERGELKRWSSGDAASFRQVYEVLASYAGGV